MCRVTEFQEGLGFGQFRKDSIFRDNRSSLCYQFQSQAAFNFCRALIDKNQYFHVRGPKAKFEKKIDV